jgi:hypothetical protein
VGAGLHAPSALRAPPDRDVKCADGRPLDRQLFLILHGHAHAAHGALAVRTPRGARRVIRLVDLRRLSAMRARPIGRPGLPAWALRRGDPRATREGRRLAIDCAPRRFERVFQFLVFAAQPLPLGLRPSQVLFPLRDPTRLVVDDLLGITRWRSIVALRHAPLMPNSHPKYKRKPQSLYVRCVVMSVRRGSARC